MFFNLNTKAIIGYKLLTDADLGTESSHQTHIGLFEGTLSFILNYHQKSFAQFIYKNQSKDLLAFLDPIANKDGSKRSPKIRAASESEINMFGTRVNSVVREIREIAQNKKNEQWYLMWFGLENNDLVFFLFEKESEDYKKITEIIGRLKNRGEIKRSDKSFSRILKFLSEKVNISNIHYVEQLEIDVQTDQISEKFIKNYKFREYDIEKAKQLFKEIGKKGESLINKFLTLRKSRSEINDFKWLNEIKELGGPYDFEITTNENKLFYTDVKTTSYNFNQKMIFSGQEFKFIRQYPNYLIHRVYNLNNKPMLRVCNNIEKITGNFNSKFNSFEKLLVKDGIKISGVKIEVTPTLNSLNFENEIIL